MDYTYDEMLTPFYDVISPQLQSASGNCPLPPAAATDEFAWIDEWLREINGQQTVSNNAAGGQSTSQPGTSSYTIDYGWLDEVMTELNVPQAPAVGSARVLESTSEQTVPTAQVTQDSNQLAANYASLEDRYPIYLEYPEIMQADSQEDLMQYGQGTAFDFPQMQACNTVDTGLQGVPIAPQGMKWTDAQNPCTDNQTAVCYNFNEPATVTLVDEGRAAVPLASGSSDWVSEAVALSLLHPLPAVWVRTNRKTTTHKNLPAALRSIPWDIRAENLLMYFSSDKEWNGWFTHVVLVFLTKPGSLEVTRDEFQTVLKYILDGGWDQDSGNAANECKRLAVPTVPYRRISRTLLIWYRKFANGSVRSIKGHTVYVTLTRITTTNTYVNCMNINEAAVKSLAEQRDLLQILVPDGVEYPPLITV
ncbi:uncharacterized protein LOC129591058 isoform X1 [Paramacrobiotus metropolitanus]|uniref:uncharacterized protein LOC129590037 n=1 Tax=Paramacrobiotus metropolitanus TaxID=2943436 RepID=UPI002445EC89|nr:uncharacterized protein LOC129590037 [Paramacrobiotus metropolitanus]XP_055342553.1 uncharacterized protein LOC129591058 isoform X1 [Paramacrobiotus metropolitanus]